MAAKPPNIVYGVRTLDKFWHFYEMPSDAKRWAGTTGTVHVYRLAPARPAKRRSKKK